MNIYLPNVTFPLERENQKGGVPAESKTNSLTKSVENFAPSLELTVFMPYLSPTTLAYSSPTMRRAQYDAAGYCRGSRPTEHAVVAELKVSYSEFDFDLARSCKRSSAEPKARSDSNLPPRH